MGRESLYLKFRPFQLSDIVGQKYIVQTLKQASIDNSFVHTYLFGGIKGTGKTTSARILANLLTCENPSNGILCGKCRACKSVQSGSSMDIIELDGANNRKVEDIRDLIDSAHWPPTELKRKVYVVDECLGRLSRVNTENGLMRIDELVHHKKNVKVWSWNFEKNCLELKPVTGWFKNSGKQVYNIKFESEGVLYASPGHLVCIDPINHTFTPVSDIKVGDIVYRQGLSLSDYQEQMIYGSLLGDASLSKRKVREKMPRSTNVRLKFIHGVAQKEYLDFKYNILSNFVKTAPRQGFHIGFKGYPEIETWKFTTLCSSQFNKFYDKAIMNGKKCISRQWLDSINEIGLAFWFCDDGSSHRYGQREEQVSVALHTECFSYDEHLILQSWLMEKFSVESSICKSRKNDKVYFFLNLINNSAFKFLNIIAPHVPKSMQYKVKINYECNDTCGIEKKQYGLIGEKVQSINENGYENVTYDIEVADNHNYFVSGTLVHNCHQLTSTAISALLKIVEEPPEYVTFIFCTTELDKIPDTILSRSQRFMFGRLSLKEVVSRLKFISEQENIKATEDALYALARMGRGSMRDSIGYLEQIATLASGKEINDKAVAKYFGMADRRGILNMLKSMNSANLSLLMDQVNDLVIANADIKNIVFEISELFRSIMVIKAKNGNFSLIELPEHEIQELMEIGDKIKFSNLYKLSRSFSTLEKEMDWGINKRWILESTLIKCSEILMEQ